MQQVVRVALGTAILILLTAIAPTGVVVAQGTVQEGPAPMRAGDILRMKIYREPELSGDYQVNELGAVILPRLGEVRVSEWPVDSLRPRLTRSFAEYLREPTIEVTVLRRIAVTGAVLRPNLYPVDPTMTVLDALALAGGAAPDGVRDRVELRRGDQRLVAQLNQQSMVADLRLQSGDQLYVPQRSWLSRNTWLVSTLIGAVATFTTIMVAR